MHGSAMSFEKTAASIFTPTPSPCSINWSPPCTVAMCLPSLVGAMLTRAQICWVSRNGDHRPVVCRTLGLSAHPEPVLDALRVELDRTYREVAQRLPNNPAVRFEKINGKEELILSPLEKLEEPVSLVKLREAVAARLPRVDIPEIVVEIAARTGFARRLRTSRNVRHALPI